MKPTPEDEQRARADDVNPCPFCDENEGIEYDHISGAEEGWVTVRCLACGASGPRYEDMEHARREWNSATDRIAEVRAEERERCAKIADIHNSHVAAAIRRTDASE